MSPEPRAVSALYMPFLAKNLLHCAVRGRDADRIIVLEQKLPDVKAEVEHDLGGGYAVLKGFAGTVAVSGSAGGQACAAESALTCAGDGLQLLYCGQITAFRIDVDAAVGRSVHGIRQESFALPVN